MSQVPTVGRIVHLSVGGDQPLAAIVTRVHDDVTVSLTVLTDSGRVLHRPSVSMGSGFEQWSWPPLSPPRSLEDGWIGGGRVSSVDHAKLAREG